MSESHFGTVVAADDKTVTVSFARSDMCAHCGACRPGDAGSMLLTLENTVSAEVGDRVTLATATGKIAKASMLAYLFPLLMLLLGIFVGSRISDICAILFGIGLCLLAYLVLRLLEKRWKRAFSLTIGQVIKKEDITDDERVNE